MNDRSFILGYLLLLALAWPQVSCSAHENIHDVPDLGEVCAVCLQLERDDDVIVGTSEIAQQLITTLAANTMLPAAPRIEAVADYQPRASP